jgi:phage gp29-like protein
MKLKSFKIYEAIGEDYNIEEKIDAVLKELLKKKAEISMLYDTISYITSDIKKTLPEDFESFMDSLQYYDDEIFDCIDNIRDKLIDGIYTLRNLSEELDSDFITLENYMKLKKL